MKVYFISGLGADKRAFYKIQLPPSYEPVFLDWIEPKKNESLVSYAQRFAESIDASEEFILIGLSFGGILASEIAKIIPPKKLIIISSVSSHSELPWYFRLLGRMKFHKIVPISFLKQATVLNRYLGKGDEKMKEIVLDYVKKTDPAFIRWSLHAIITWGHSEKLPGLIHIHGNKDHLLPSRYVKADHLVKQGGHLMILNKASEITEILSAILATE